MVAKIAFSILNSPKNRKYDECAERGGSVTANNDETTSVGLEIRFDTTCLQSVRGALLE